jgi:hypothetical protein
MMWRPYYNAALKLAALVTFKIMGNELKQSSKSSLFKRPKSIFSMPGSLPLLRFKFHTSLHKNSLASRRSLFGMRGWKNWELKSLVSNRSRTSNLSPLLWKKSFFGLLHSGQYLDDILESPKYNSFCVYKFWTNWLFKNHIRKILNS